MRALLVVLLLAGVAHAGKRVDPSVLEALRTAGSVDIAPARIDEDVDMMRETVDVCVNAHGKVKSAKIVSSSHDKGYDRLVVRTIKKTWRFDVKKTTCARFELRYSLIGSGPPPPSAIDDTSLPPPPPPPKIETVTPKTLEAQRLTGDPNILPDDATKALIAASGKTRVIAATKLCIDDTGHVTDVKILKGSGFDDYDRRIESTMRGWTYKPYLINGVASPVCTAITLIYLQQ